MKDGQFSCTWCYHSGYYYFAHSAESCFCYTNTTFYFFITFTVFYYQMSQINSCCYLFYFCTGYGNVVLWFTGYPTDDNEFCLLGIYFHIICFPNVSYFMYYGLQIFNCVLKFDCIICVSQTIDIDTTYCYSFAVLNLSWKSYPCIN